MSAEPQESLPSQPRTIKRGGGRAWVHPATTSGRYSRIRLATSLTLLTVLYATPWITIGGRPLFRLSFLDTSFTMFGQPVLIYESYHFVLMALLLVFTLFFASAAYGRIWCGYACPQTVFIEQLFGRIETWLEGPAARRIANEGKPLDWSRAWRKGVKQALFVVVATSFAFSIVALFTGPEAIYAEHSRPALTALGILTGLAWFDGAYWREQFCQIVCPYGRFQSLMQDQATRTIGYDAARGEPRRRGKKRDGAGDCIDCGLCVRVCPAGIDIRQGPTQLECIGCGKCVDACAGVMKSVDAPSGLIRYDAVAMFATPPPPRRPRFLRPRLLTYAAIWLALFTVGVYQFVSREPYRARLLSARGAAPYVVDGESVKNLVSIKVGNQWHAAERYALTIEGGATIASPVDLGPIEPGREAIFPVLIVAPRRLANQKVTLRLKASGSGVETTFERTIMGPQ